MPTYGGGSLPPYQGPPMNLIPKAIFNSTFARQRVYPWGGDRRQMVGDEHGRQEMALISFPEVLFENHHYDTTDPRIAKKLVETNRFGARDGWSLDPSCLPEALREFFPRLPIAERRKVVLGLIGGCTDEQAFDLIDPELLDKAQARVEEGGPSILLVCPHAGCGLRFGAEGQEANKTARIALAQHVNVMHGGKVES